MKQTISTMIFLMALVFSTVNAGCQKVNKLTKEEKNDGWVLLFNGKDFEGWRACNGDAMPSNWTIEDGAMKVFLGEGKKPGQGAGGDILYGCLLYTSGRNLYRHKNRAAGKQRKRSKYFCRN